MKTNLPAPYENLSHQTQLFRQAKMKIRRVRFARALLPLLIGIPFGVTAQTWTWSPPAGAAAPLNWSAGANWTPTPPAAAGAPAPGVTTALVFNYTAAYPAVADAGLPMNPFRVNSLTFGGPLPPPKKNPIITLKGPVGLRITGATPTINQNSSSWVYIQNPITLDPGVVFTSTAGTGRTTLNGGVMDGTGGDLTVAGTGNNPGALFLLSPVAGPNSYTGGTTVNSGGILMINSGAVGTGALILNDGAQIGATGPPYFMPIPNNNFQQGVAFVGVPVTINGDVTYGNPDTSQSLQFETGKQKYVLNFDKGATLTANVTITVVNRRNSADPLFFKNGALASPGGKTSDNMLVISGLADDPAGPYDITVTGGGILKFNGVNTTTGDITINQGTVALAGAGTVLQPATTVTVEANAILKGSGRVGKAIVKNQGTITAKDDPGILVVASGLEIDAGGQLEAELDGPAGVGATNGYSQIQVSGGTTIDNASLFIYLNYNPSSNDVFYLVDNQDSLPMTASFTNTYQLNGATWVNALDRSSGQLYAFEVNATADYEGQDPYSTNGNDLAIFNAQPIGNPLPPVPPSLTIIPADDGSGDYNLAATVWPVGSNYVLQATSNLSPPVVWTPVSTNMSDEDGNWYWTGLPDTNVMAQFYRLMVAP